MPYILDSSEIPLCTRCGKEPARFCLGSRCYCRKCYFYSDLEGAPNTARPESNDASD